MLSMEKMTKSQTGKKAMLKIKRQEKEKRLGQNRKIRIQVIFHL